MSPRRIAPLISLALLWLSASLAQAACTDPSDLLQFQKAVSRELSCGRKRIRGSEVTCGQEQVPACAGNAVADLIELVFDGPPAPADVKTLRREWSCQRAVSSKSGTYVKLRLRELLAGRRSTAGSRALNAISRRCDGVVVAGALPRIGGSCASLSSVGGQIDGAALSACVRASLERITQQAAPAPLRPNILMILTDDQRSDTLDVMPRVREHLIARGIEFTNGFVNTSLCCPDRATILTGLYAHNHGVKTNRGALDFDHSDTIAVHLRAGGYKTALLGKYMVNTGAALGTSVPPGWDEWRVFMNNSALYYDYRLNQNGVAQMFGSAPADYSTDLLADFTAQFIQAHVDEPFFAIYAPHAPHTKAIPAPRHEGAFQGIPPWRPPNWQEQNLEDKPAWVYTNRVLAAFDSDLVEGTDQSRIDQLESLLAVDEAVEKLSLLLETTGLTDNTLVIFTSDNGYLWLEHWLRLKNYPYEESIRVPLVIRYPVLAPAARQSDELAVPIDFAPTFAELAGIAGPAVTNGQSLVPLLRGDAGAWREDILIEHFAGAWIDPNAGVRTRRWKYIETEAEDGVTEELYDLDNDPYELQSVAQDPLYDSQKTQLRARLQALLLE